ncbi:hypothetical protein B0T13DRAFT_207257 [Neurospora crassa]|nr:hypothetical protein B0T13DRAFT_207257 [Neurospora crassa]
MPHHRGTRRHITYACGSRGVIVFSRSRRRKSAFTAHLLQFVAGFGRSCTILALDTRLTCTIRRIHPLDHRGIAATSSLLAKASANIILHKSQRGHAPKHPPESISQQKVTDRTTHLSPTTTGKLNHLCHRPRPPALSTLTAPHSLEGIC